MLENNTIIRTKIQVKPESKLPFIEWQGDFNSLIASFPGFISLEISALPESSTWLLVQRFSDATDLINWLDSEQRKKIMNHLKPYLAKDETTSLIEDKMEINQPLGNVTEVFVTQVHPEKEEAFRKWIAKIHTAEATFPGFRGAYVQSPKEGKSKNWITLLQFDTLENLEKWLTSSERKNVLNESKDLIESLESHRVISPFAGWFASVSRKGVTPPVWKQTMLILLVLFPIVMIELKYLNPNLASLNSSLATFIGNAISVSLISWPMLPFAIRSLKWWLLPKEENCQKIHLLGTALVLTLYLIEIAIFWKFL